MKDCLAPILPWQWLRPQAALSGSGCQMAMAPGQADGDSPELGKLAPVSGYMQRGAEGTRAPPGLAGSAIALRLSPSAPEGCGTGLATSGRSGGGTCVAFGREKPRPRVGPPTLPPPRHLAYHRVPVDVDLPLLGAVGEAAAPQALAVQALLRQLLRHPLVQVGCGGREPWGGGGHGDPSVGGQRGLAAGATAHGRAPTGAAPRQLPAAPPGAQGRAGWGSTGDPAPPLPSPPRPLPARPPAPLRARPAVPVPRAPHRGTRPSRGRARRPSRDRRPRARAPART